MNKLQNLSPIERASMAEKLIVLLTGTDLPVIDSHVRSGLITAIGTLPATLRTQETDAENLNTQARAAFTTRDVSSDGILEWLRTFRDTLTASNAPKELWDLCGLDYPTKTRSTVVAQTPTALFVEGFSNGTNRGKFVGNNKGKNVTFEIWRREGDEGQWGIRMTVKQSFFDDAGVTPGQFYEYKVRAKAAKTESQFSNPAVVYGQ